MKMPVIIAFDVMGSEHGPSEIVRGAVALTSEASNVHAVLVGDQSQVDSALASLRYHAERISVHHVSDWIAQGEVPLAAVDAKPEASVCVAARLVREGDAHAVVSVGHPGAFVAACQKLLPRLPNVDRIALGGVWPTATTRGQNADPFCLLLDVGAGAEASGEELATFALMGSCFARLVSRNSEPKVALLANGAETLGEAQRITEAKRRLEMSPGINFIGIIEGMDIPRGTADVVVCDGLVGNVCLKVLEGTSETVVALAGSAARSGLPWRIGLQVLARGIEGIKGSLALHEYAGAPILGLEGVLMKVHPSSSARSIANAGKVAERAVRHELIQEMRRQLTAS